MKSKYTIRAPFDGYVVNKMSEVGAWVQQGAPIVEIVQLDQMDFVFNVPQDLVSEIQSTFDPNIPDLEIQIAIDGVEQTFAGKITAIIPQADLRSRMLPIRARFDNVLMGGQPLLKPGMIGRGKVALGKPREMLLVKKDALVLGGREPVVYKVSGTGDQLTASLVPVKTGLSVGSWIEVSGQLSEQDQVVVQGNERLRPDQSISILSKNEDAPQLN